MKCLSLLALLLALTSCQNPSRPLPLDSLVDRYFIADGGLTSYVANLIGPHRRVASYVDRIFNGEKPADLLVINLETAKVLGLNIPITLLALAHEVIE
jgi:hypothetical protein